MAASRRPHPAASRCGGSGGGGGGCGTAATATTTPPVLLLLAALCCSTLPAGAAGQNIWEVLRTRDDLATTQRLLERTNLHTELQKAGAYTVFLPTEAAWDAAGRGSEVYLEQFVTDLAVVLRYHVVPGVSLNTAQSVGATPLTTLHGATLSVTQSIPTQGGGGGGYIANGVATVTGPNVAASNGMIHLVNRLLVPAGSLAPVGTIYDHIRANPATFSTLDGHLGATPSLRGTLSAAVPRWNRGGVVGVPGSNVLYTFFAPTNAAFAALTPAQLSEIVGTSGLLARVLNHHASQTYLPYNHGTALTNINTTEVLPTFDAPHALVYSSLPSPSLNRTVPLRFVGAAFPCTNGIIVYVDTVVLPPAVLVPLNVVEVLGANPTLARTTQLVRSSGLDQYFEGNSGSNINDQYTVFAPTDAAWGAIKKGEWELIVRDAKVAQAVIGYHALQGVGYNAVALRNLNRVTTVQGDTLQLSYNTNGQGFVHVNSRAKVVVADQIASNGVVHIVDKVLLQEVAPFTTLKNIVGVVGAAPQHLARAYEALTKNSEVFNLFSDEYGGAYTFLAPSDAAFARFTPDQLASLLGDQQRLTTLLRYHTLAGYWSVNDFVQRHNALNPTGGAVRGAYQTIYADAANSNTANETLDALVATGGFIKFFDASGREGVMNRTLSDLPATNGIVHVVDELLLPAGNLLPGNTVVDVLSKQGSASRFYDLIKVGGLTENLQRAGPFTVFAPTNDGLAKLGTGVLPYYVRRASELQQALLHHTVLDSVRHAAATLVADSPLLTQQAEYVRVAQTSGTVNLVVDSKATITFPDLFASNGVVHLVDAFLPQAAARHPTQTVHDLLAVGSSNAVLAGGSAATMRWTAWKGVAGYADPADQRELLYQEAGPLTVFVVDDGSWENNVDEALRAVLQGTTDKALLQNVLRYHSVRGVYLDVADLVRTSPGSVQTVDAPFPLSHAVSPTTNRVVLNGNVEIIGSLPASNGIIHFVNDLLVRDGLFPAVPPAGSVDTLWDVLSLRNEVSTFYGYAKTANMQFLLSSLAGSRKTLFAPRNDALVNVPHGWKELFTRNITLLQDIVRYHVLEAGSYAAAALPAASPAATARAGEALTFTQDSIHVVITANRDTTSSAPAGAANTKAQIHVPDIPASNGMMHVTTDLLIPRSVADTLPFLHVYGVIEAQPSLSTFLSVLLTLSTRSPNSNIPFSNLAATLKSRDGLYTVFAPSNAALQAYPLLPSLLSTVPTPGAATDPLLALAQHHVHTGYRTENDLRTAAPTALPTLASLRAATNNNLIQVKTEAGGTVVVLGGLVRLSMINLYATNGVVHIIDTVLPFEIPAVGVGVGSLQDVLGRRDDTTDFARTTASVGLYNELSGAVGTGNAGPYTVFAPSNQAWAALPIGVREMLSRRLDVLANVMKYHVVSGVGLTAISTPTASPATTMQGNTLTMAYNTVSGVVTLRNTAETIVTDIRASNGVAHVTNQVLDYPNSPLPQQNLVHTAGSNPSLTTFSALLRASSLASVLSALDPTNLKVWTLLAPTDAAFQRLTPQEFNAYLADPNSFVRDHVIENQYLTAGDLHATSPGQKLSMTQKPITYRVGAPVIVPSRDADTLQSSGGSVVVFNYQTTQPSNLVTHDIPATNGVIHLVDRVVGAGVVGGGPTPVPVGVPATPSPVSNIPPEQRMLVWGAPAGGGDARAVSASLSGGGMSRVYSNDVAFAALPASGLSVVAWGDPVAGGSPPVLTGVSPITNVVNTRFAFAGLRADGSVVAWGDASAGGSVAPAAQDVACCVSAVYATSRAFVAVKSNANNGKVVAAWGDATYGGVVPVAAGTALTNFFQQQRYIQSIYSNDGAFAAVVSTPPQNPNAPNVVTWGVANQGGDSVAVAASLAGVVSISSTYSSFAALTYTGNVVTWGAADTGGQSTTVAQVLSSGNVRSVASTTTAFAALMKDSRVVAWGKQGGGGDSSIVDARLTGVTKVVSTDGAFAALKTDGTVVTWGGAGGDSTTVASVLTGVTDVAATDSAFAAVKSDGTVVSWGSSGYGGSVPDAKKPLLQNVRRIVANSRAFAAVRADNSVVAWGDDSSGGSARVPVVGTEQLLLQPVATAGGQIREIAATKAAFAAYFTLPPAPTPPPGVPPTTPGGLECNILYCSGNHISYTLVGSLCVCNCRLQYTGGRCQLCASGYVNYPICSPAVTTPVPWLVPTPRPVGGPTPATPLPSQLPLPTPPPTTCLAWTACNGHARSVADSPLAGGGCICSCLANYAGETCDTCASGFYGYPLCSPGNWVLVSETHACKMNVEDTAPVHGTDTDLLPSMLACHQSCSERPWCKAVDWYRTAQRCRMYRDSCADPKDPLDGASHWRIVTAGGGLGTPAPTPVPTVEQGCPWVSPTGREDEFDCTDGTTCNLRLHGTGCCSSRGGRMRCPINLPVMCSSIDAQCDNDYCCVATDEDCAPNGGKRPCTGMMVTPCGVAKAGGDAAVWVSGTKARVALVPPVISNVRGVFANEEAYAAVRMDGSVVTWGADYAGGDAATVASALEAGVVKVFSTDRAFAALKTGGQVVTWGDNGLGAAPTDVALLQLLERDVLTVFSTSNAFAALKRNGGVVTWGHRYDGADSTTVAHLIASGVASVFATRKAFAALRVDGSVVTWGALHEGGGSSAVGPLLTAAPGVRTIAATDSAFAAIRKDGSVVTWGYPGRGGSSATVASMLTRDVVDVFGNSMAFAALKANRSVVTWGAVESGGDSAAVSQPLASSVSSVHATRRAFAAVRSDRSVVAWGDPQAGGQVPPATRSQLFAAKTVTATDRAFAVLRSDGVVVPWGDAGAGGAYTGSDPLSSVRVVHGNRAEFAAIHNNGKVTVWGGTQGGGVGGTGDYVGCATALNGVPAYRYGLGARSVVSTSTAFAFLTEPENTPVPPVLPTLAPNGGQVELNYYPPVKVWGDPLAGGRVPSDIGAQLTCGHVYSTQRAFAAVRADGSVATWGDAGYGGDSATVAHRLGGAVRTVFTTERAFAALLDSGAVVAWGDYGYGGNVQAVKAARLTAGVRTVYSTQLSFAAVLDSGAVVTWGDRYYGGDAVAVEPFLQSGVVGVYSTDQAFAALKTGGEVITWGAGYAGADSTLVRERLRTGVQAVYKTYSAFAALKTGGAVVTWGYPGRGGDSSTVAAELLAGVQALASTEMAFAALKKQQGTSTAGKVVTWGDDKYGGNSVTVSGLLSSGVKAVYATQRAFAAVKTDGSVVTWGNASYGGFTTQIHSQLKGVSEIYTTERAFAALLETGRVVTWGDSGYGGRWSASSHALTDVQVIYATNRAFTALRSDGTLVSWGNLEFGGDATGARDTTGYGHKAVYSTESAFAALNPCGLGSKLRPAGQGACLDSQGRRYGELKAEAQDRAACMQLLLQHSPPARGATWWPDAPLTANGVGGCYVAVDANSTIQGGVWADRFSYDTRPNGLRNARGTVSTGDGQAGMECVAADDVAAVPTPPPGTPAPTPEPTPAPGKQTFSWALTSRAAACGENAEGIRPTEHLHPLPTLEACQRSCEERPGCKAVDYYGSGWCNLYDEPCTGPLDTAPGAQSWRFVEGSAAGFAVVAWGDRAAGADVAPVQNLLDRGVRAVYGGELAFAALKVDGTVVTWGSGFAGGDSSTVQELLRAGASSPVVDVVAGSRAFAAVTSRGDVVAWGDSLRGGSATTVASLLQGTTAVYSNPDAFAAVTPVGLVAWGDALSGGDATTVRQALLPTQTVTNVAGNARAFAAVTNDGRVVAWGDQATGGDVSTVAVELSLPTRRVSDVSATRRAFAARRDDGSVVTWGDAGRGGSSLTVAALLSSGVTRVYATDTAFAALKDDGSVVAWGDVLGGGAAPALATGIGFIVPTKRAFAAVKPDGTVVTWGDAGAGGLRPVTPANTGIAAQTVVGSDAAFTALLANGAVDAWGDPASGGTPPAAGGVGQRLSYLTSTSQSFAGITAAGTALAWGNAQTGGDVTPVASQLSRGVAGIARTDRAFAALVPSLVSVPDVPPSTGLDGCAEDAWVAAPTKRCVEGVNTAGEMCDQRAVLGGTVQRYFCAYRTRGVTFGCVRCATQVAYPNMTASPPTTPPGPTTDVPTSGDGHGVTICSELTDRTTGTADKTLTIGCPAGGGTLAIQNVFYGREACGSASSAGALCKASALATPNCATGAQCTAGDAALTYVRNLCSEQGVCTINLADPALLDPCVGVSKYMSVDYVCRAYVCEKRSTVEWGRVTGQSGDQYYDLRCGSDSQLVVDTAVYGRTTCHKHLCYAFPGTNCAVQGCAANVTATVKTLCNGEQTCRVEASAAALGITDPCPGENKYLDVTYTCQGIVGRVSRGACRDVSGNYFRELKKSQTSRDECAQLLRRHQDTARGAMHWPNRGCYLAVDFDSPTTLPPTQWDALNSTDSYIGLRRGRGQQLFLSTNPADTPEGAECLTVGDVASLPPTGGGGLTPSPAGVGNGMCGQAATALRQCFDSTNAYWCNGLCCCEEQREFRCDAASGLCKFRFTPPQDTPLPAPPTNSTPAPPGAITPLPLPVVPPGGKSTFPPGSPGGPVRGVGATGTDDDDSLMWIWIVIALALACLCCMVIAFCLGTRNAKAKRDEAAAAAAADTKESPLGSPKGGYATRYG